MSEEIEVYHPENDVSDETMNKVNSAEIKLKADEIVYNKLEKEDERKDGAYGEAKEIVFNELDKHNDSLEEEENKRRNVDPKQILSISKVVTNEDLFKTDEKYSGNDVPKLDKYTPKEINKN